jgi:hypothetical protein
MAQGLAQDGEVKCMAFRQEEQASSRCVCLCVCVKGGFNSWGVGHLGEEGGGAAGLECLGA